MQARTRPGKFFHQDHCHEFNLLRDYICRDCNLMLGLARDNINTLENAIEYLKHRASIHAEVRARQIQEQRAVWAQNTVVHEPDTVVPKSWGRRVPAGKPNRWALVNK